MERVRSCGGYIEDGYLNGDLTVTRGIGDFHLEALKRKKEQHTPFTGPLIAEPEIQIRTLTTEDEFVVLACDGLWDSPGFKGEKGSQRVIELARQNLQQNDNDAQKCAQYLVDLSLQQQATDNLTVLVICLTPEAPPKRDTDLKRSVSQNGFSTLRNALQEADDSSSKVLL
jgi:protein phosphatase 2C family protein 2/3